jgi:hypothetical protein
MSLSSRLAVRDPARGAGAVGLATEGTKGQKAQEVHRKERAPDYGLTVRIRNTAPPLRFCVLCFCVSVILCLLWPVWPARGARSRARGGCGRIGHRRHKRTEGTGGSQEGAGSGLRTDSPDPEHRSTSAFLRFVFLCFCYFVPFVASLASSRCAILRAGRVRSDWPQKAQKDRRHRRFTGRSGLRTTD